MILEPRCSERHCKHLIGVKQSDGTEATEIAFCSAFKDGIPEEISYGENLHSRPLPGQGNNIVFEEE